MGRCENREVRSEKGGGTNPELGEEVKREAKD
jgi:hypothetical protein